MKYLFILFAISTLFSCNSNTNPSADKPIVPLNTGNYWHYRFIKFTSRGDTMLVQDRYVRVIRDTTIAGERYFVVQQQIGTSTPSEWLASNRSDGHYLGSTNPILSLPYPAVVGTTHVYRTMLDQGSEPVEYVDSLHVLSIDTLVTVPAGTFHSYVCRQVETTIVFGGSVVRDKYYTPGVGLVQSINYAPVSPYGPPFPTKIGEELLMDYKVN